MRLPKIRARRSTAARPLRCTGRRPGPWCTSPPRPRLDRADHRCEVRRVDLPRGPALVVVVVFSVGSGVRESQREGGGGRRGAKAIRVRQYKSCWLKREGHRAVGSDRETTGSLSTSIASLPFKPGPGPPTHPYEPLKQTDKQTPSHYPYRPVTYHQAASPPPFPNPPHTCGTS